MSTAVSFLPVTEKNVEVFKVINVHCLPVRYAEKFYADIVKTPQEFTKFAVVNDVIVGLIGCRLEPRADGKSDLYVMTLSILTPYRRLGVGQKLLQSVLEAVAKQSTIARVYLHVQTSNADALAFYAKFEFHNIGIVEGYYNKITPPDAVLLEKPFDEIAAKYGAAAAK